MSGKKGESTQDIKKGTQGLQDEIKAMRSEIKALKKDLAGHEKTQLESEGNPGTLRYPHLEHARRPDCN